MANGKACTTADQWRECIGEQERSGLSVKQFCKERGLSVWSFYAWRKRLRETTAVRFALVDRGAEQEAPTSAGLEVIFVSGERVRIRSGVDGATLRTVLRVLRG